MQCLVQKEYIPLCPRCLKPFLSSFGNVKINFFLFFGYGICNAASEANNQRLFASKAIFINIRLCGNNH